MEGYSVTEAASILGVPTERVWELLARGVLSGAPEGETGMRVYLQPRPAPAPPAPEPRPNGDAEPTRELSPFRELLTEFRNLTERYGQALLALGEARGEVAALRSRVDLLEARMDLRLPMTAGPMTPPTPWPTPMPAAPTPAVAGDSPLPRTAHEEHADDEHADEDRRRRRGARRATESFAEALARAEDPTPSELPDAAETAAALAALRDEADAGAAETALPRELPAAELMPLADEPEAEAIPAVQPEPVDVPASVPEAAEMVAEAESKPEPEPELIAEPEPEPEAELIAEPEPVVAAEAEPTLEAEPEPVADAEPEPEAAEEAAATEPESPEARDPVAAGPEDPAVASASATHDTDAGDVQAEPIAWDPERYTVEIVEPDWYADEAMMQPDASPSDAVPEAAAELGSHSEPKEAAPPQDSVATPEPVAERPAESPPPVPEADEETMLWFGRRPPSADDMPAPDSGADEMEVAGAQPRAGASPLPGSQELDDALAALDALAPPVAPIPEEPLADARADEEDDSWPPAVGRESSAPPQVPEDEAELPIRPAGTLTSLTRPSTTSATRAYRRLRRIFPG
jgi:hypothetical protein